MIHLKKSAIICFLISIVAVAFTGCGNRQVIVATINDKQVSEPLYNIFLWSTQRGLESLQNDFWKLDNIEGKTPEEYAKEKALKSISYCIVVEQKAKELNIKLTKEEKDKVKQAAKKAMEENKALSNKYKISRKDYEAYYTYAAQNEKITKILAESYEPNSNEIKVMQDKMLKEQAFNNTATITHILIRTQNELGEALPTDKLEEAEDKARSVLNKALKGESFEELVKLYSEDEASYENKGVYTFKQGSMEESIESIVFNPEIGLGIYPELIKTSMGYEIIKIDKRDMEKEEEFMNRVETRVKEEFAASELSELVDMAKIKKTENYSELHKIEPILETS